MPGEYFTLDRFEGDWAVLIPESGEGCISVEKSLISGAAEGDVVMEIQGGWQVDSLKTAQLRTAMAERWKGIRDKGKGLK